MQRAPHASCAPDAAPEEAGSAPGEAAASPLWGKSGLRRAALRASFFDMSGYAASQGLRLASNLILTRLLFPEAFGLMALVNITNQALVMLSDVGLQQAVVQNPRGDEPAFLDTAWTVQVMRGAILYGVALLLAWPLAVLYREPRLAGFIAVGSISVLINGSSSTALFMLRRRLRLGTIAAIEIGAQVTAIAVMVPIAYLFRTPWALVCGLIAGPTFSAIASHAVDVGHRNRLRIDPVARRELFAFGKWIFASSAIFFLGQQGDRIMLGRLMGVAELGIYSVAVFLSDAVKAAVVRLGSSVLFPILSRVHERGKEEFRRVYYRARLPLDALALPALGVLTMLGPWVVHVLYDRRYAEAGWILQFFAFRVAVTCLLSPTETCLFSTGQARYGLFENAARLAWIAVGVPLGYHLFGLVGIVVATAASELPLTAVLWVPFHRMGHFRPLLELRAASFYGAGLLVGWLLSFVLRA